MPETDTPVLDPKPDTGQPGPPPGPSEGGGQGGFGSLAGAVYQTTDEWKRSAAKVRDDLKAKAERMEPTLKDAEGELSAQIRYGRDNPPPAAPTLTQPPSRQLTEFLAPVDGESPVVSVTKLLQAIGLFATGASGAVKGDARAGLAAFTGAMKGWQEGDRERADRHFADWEAKTATALTKWRTERATYQDIMEAANLSLDQRFKLLQLAAIREDNKAMADVAEKKDLEALLGFLGSQQAHADAIELKVATLAQSKQLREEQMAMQERLAHERTQDRIDARRDKSERDAERDQAAVDAYPPEALRALGVAWAKTGKMPSIGYAGKGAALVIRGKAVQEGLAWAKEQGIPPESLPGYQAEVAASRNALSRVTVDQARLMSFVNNFDSAVKYARELSEKVDRTGSPVLNRYILYTRGQYKGDPDVTNFETQVNVIASEYAKIMVGNAQGDANTREEARRLISTSLTKDQFNGVVSTLTRDTEFRRAGYEKEKKQHVDFLKGVPPAKMPDAPPLANDPLGIRR